MTTELTRTDPLVFHFRLGRGKDMLPKAGVTVVYLPGEKRFGVALCGPKDRYDKKWGRHAATVRAKEGERAKEGKRSPRTKRFHSFFDYDSVDLALIRALAMALALEASHNVGNPFSLWSEEHYVESPELDKATDILMDFDERT